MKKSLLLSTSGDGVCPHSCHAADIIMTCDKDVAAVCIALVTIVTNLGQKVIKLKKWATMSLLTSLEVGSS